MSIQGNGNILKGIFYDYHYDHDYDYDYHSVKKRQIEFFIDQNAWSLDASTMLIEKYLSTICKLIMYENLREVISSRLDTFFKKVHNIICFVMTFLYSNYL